MVFSIPENLHPELMPLAWLIGTWRGKGRCEYPNTQGFEFAQEVSFNQDGQDHFCLLYTSPSPRDRTRSRMPSSA